MAVAAVLLGLVAAAISTSVAAAATAPVAAPVAAPVSVTVPSDADDAPPVTVNPFFPEDRSLSECLSVVPRPGCGSEARGGPYQAAVFGAIVLGLALIGTRIVIGLRRNQRSSSDAPTG